MSIDLVTSSGASSKRGLEDHEQTLTISPSGTVIGATSRLFGCYQISAPPIGLLHKVSEFIITIVKLIPEGHLETKISINVIYANELNTICEVVNSPM